MDQKKLQKSQKQPEIHSKQSLIPPTFTQKNPSQNSIHFHSTHKKSQKTYQETPTSPNNNNINNNDNKNKIPINVSNPIHLETLFLINESKQQQSPEKRDSSQHKNWYDFKSKEADSKREKLRKDLKLVSFMIKKYKEFIETYQKLQTEKKTFKDKLQNE